MRIALITGASRGIGRAIAKKYAENGLHCVLVARSVKDLEETDDIINSVGGSATIVPLDLMKHDMIDSLAASIYEKYGRLDVLVGNAGMLGGLSPIAHIKPEAWNNVISLNLTANYRLIRAFDSLLRLSDAGRAIFVTSGITARSEAYWGAYAASKAALEMMAKTYASEVEFTKVRVNLVSPGIVNTAMRAQAFPGENKDSLANPDDVSDIFIKLASPEFNDNGKIFTAD